MSIIDYPRSGESKILKGNSEIQHDCHGRGSKWFNFSHDVLIIIVSQKLLFCRLKPAAQLFKRRTSKQNFCCLNQGYIRYNVLL